MAREELHERGRTYLRSTWVVSVSLRVLCLQSKYAPLLFRRHADGLVRLGAQKHGTSWAEERPRLLGPPHPSSRQDGGFLGGGEGGGASSKIWRMRRST